MKRAIRIGKNAARFLPIEHIRFSGLFDYGPHRHAGDGVGSICVYRVNFLAIYLLPSAITNASVTFTQIRFLQRRWPRI